MNLTDFAARCGWPAKEPIIRARLEVLGLLAVCNRCKGTGRYENNPLDKTCYGCTGSGKRLPPLTARLAATVRGRQDAGDLDTYYASARERASAAEQRAAKTLENLVPDMVAYAGARNPGRSSLK